MPSQTIQLSTNDASLEINQQFEVVVSYNLIDSTDNTLTGIGFEITFDTNELQLESINPTFNTSLFGSPSDSNPSGTISLAIS